MRSYNFGFCLKNVKLIIDTDGSWNIAVISSIIFSTLHTGVTSDLLLAFDTNSGFPVAIILANFLTSRLPWRRYRRRLYSSSITLFVCEVMSIASAPGVTEYWRTIEIQHWQLMCKHHGYVLRRKMYKAILLPIFSYTFNIPLSTFTCNINQWHTPIKIENQFYALSRSIFVFGTPFFHTIMSFAECIILWCTWLGKSNGLNGTRLAEL